MLLTLLFDLDRVSDRVSETGFAQDHGKLSIK